MSRPSNLPPRCPLQRKGIGRPTLERSSFNSHRVHEFGSRHQKSLSQGSLFEDQPAWLDELLCDADAIPKGRVHQRSASDSGTFFDGLVPEVVLSSSRQNKCLGLEEDSNTFEAGCVYGPNSPRRKSNMDFSDASVLLALSDYVTHSRTPEQFVEDISWSSRASHLDMNADCYNSPNKIDCEPKTGNSCKHPGQRSRARKLQYIAELERTINVFQALESELTIRVSALLQQRVVLSKENNKLKQQMLKLQQEKLMMDGEYQTLRKEADRLKLRLASSLSSKTCTFSGATDSSATGDSWQVLELKNLHL